MVLILSKNFADGYKLKRALETFAGIGSLTSSKIMAKFCLAPTVKVGSLAPNVQIALTAELTGMTIESDLRRKVQDDIARLRDMGTYRGRRHAMGLPVRGQRTRSQILTARKYNKVVRVA